MPAMPGDKVCVRHLKKKFVWGGQKAPELQGGRQLVAGDEEEGAGKGKETGGGKVSKVVAGMYLEVKFDGDWWQAKVLKVKGKRCEVSYIGGEDEETSWFDTR